MYTQTIEGYVKQPKYFWEFVQVRRGCSDEPVLRRKFQICTRCVTYKLNVIYLKSISNDVSFQSAEKVRFVDRYQKTNIRIFDYWLEKLSSAFKPYGWKFFSISIQKSSCFCNRSVAQSLSIFILSSCSVKVNLLCWLKLRLGSLKCWSSCGTFCLLTFLQWLFNLMPSFVSDFPMYWIQ